MCLGHTGRQVEMTYEALSWPPWWVTLTGAVALTRVGLGVCSHPMFPVPLDRWVFGEGYRSATSVRLILADSRQHPFYRSCPPSPLQLVIILIDVTQTTGNSETPVTFVYMLYLLKACQLLIGSRGH